MEKIENEYGNLVIHPEMNRTLGKLKTEREDNNKTDLKYKDFEDVNWNQMPQNID